MIEQLFGSIGVRDGLGATIEAIVDRRQWERAERQTAFAAPADPASRLVMSHHGPVRPS